MNIGLVGCGYISASYAKTLDNYPELRLVGAYDRNQDNLEKFARRWNLQRYGSYEELLGDPKVDIVLNLTNPRSHYEINRQAVLAGKHVYSEKPLAVTYTEAKELVDLAKARNLYLSSAPCSLLSDTAQTMWKAIRSGMIGRVRLVYANFDDGFIAPNYSPWQWRSEIGVLWPAKDEFEVGCTYEHAGYLLTWLAAFFGPARAVTSFASCQIPDKGIAVDKMAPDFSVGCIEYDDNIVARVTCSLVAPRDRSLRVIGNDGVLFVKNVRDERSPVWMRYIPERGWRRSLRSLVNRCLRRTGSQLRVAWPGNDSSSGKRLPFVRRTTASLSGDRNKRVDFCRGLAELAGAISERRPCRLSAHLGLHITELIEALQYPQQFGGRRLIESAFDPIEPLFGEQCLKRVH